MPKGVYPRTANQLRAAVANLALGHGPQARAKATAKAQANAKDPEWRKKVSIATREAMRRPEIRQRHLAALTKLPCLLRGGNGQEPVEAEKIARQIYGPLGFLPGIIIKTRGHGTQHRAPTHYKPDLANLQTKQIIEIDGPSHLPFRRQEEDRKKTEILQALGWTVIRIKHS